MVDLFTGMAAYGAVLTALWVRERTGKGQYIEAALLDGQVTCMSYWALHYLATGRTPGRMGSAHPSVCPYQVFQTRDGYFILGVANDGLWRRFCSALGLDHLVDHPKFRTNNERVKNRKELVAILSELFLTRTTREWVELIDGAGIPCGPVQDVPSVLNDPQVQERGMIISIPHPKIPDLKAPGPPFKLSETPSATKRYPPLLGEHNEEVLGELGYSREEVARLREEGVI
jgi:crotonobetainyl-CoA:carnitine CoA-transferase CaiB-like acyl-CoA transferase